MAWRHWRFLRAQGGRPCAGEFFSTREFASSFGSVLSGFWLDVRIFLLVEVAVLILGLLIALCRIASAPILFPLKVVCVVFVDVMRGVPTLLTVYVIGFGVPALNLSGLPTSATVLGGIALTLCYSAYVSEVFRAGIQSVHPSQGGAALALGLTRQQALRYVIVPQAVRRVATAVAERLHLGPEGRRAHLRDRTGGSSAHGSGRLGGEFQLHAVPFCRGVVPLHHGSADANRRQDAGPRAYRTRRHARTGAAMSKPVLEIRGVTKSYGDKQVLGGIDVTVNEHEAVALIGASGSGKSTLLRCVDLLEEIDDGDIFLEGECITVPNTNPVPFRRRLGLVFQAFNLFPHLRVLDNVTLGAIRGQGADPETARREGLELLERFGLGDRGRDYPDRLSGGQQQRVAIARAILTRPRALLLDEVTSALDPELVGDVLNTIRELKADGMTMIIATHEMNFARDVADHVCFLQDGRIIEQAAPDELFTNPKRPETQRFLARLLAAR